MRLETIHPKELGEAQVEQWRGLLAPGADSPYLTPEWAQVIGEVRKDARIVLINDGDGFFGAQILSRFSAMGLGAPISDCQGVIARPELAISGSALCRALNVGRIDLTHVVHTHGAFVPAHCEGSWIAETHGGRELYDAALKSRRSEFVRQLDKKARKLERDFGPTFFRAVSAESTDFEMLLTWKNAQLAHSGQPQVWAQPWVRRVLDRCFQTRDSRFGGALFTLHVRDDLAAAAFCLRSARVLHFWVLAHDTAFDQFSPGVLLARRAIGWAAENGIAEVDFGPGEYQFKRQLSTTQRALHWGVASRLSLSGAVRRSEYAMRRQIERVPAPRIATLPGKAMRRLDLMRALKT